MTRTSTVALALASMAALKHTAIGLREHPWAAHCLRGAPWCLGALEVALVLNCRASDAAPCTGGHTARLALVLGESAPRTVREQISMETQSDPAPMRAAPAPAAAVVRVFASLTDIN